MSFAAAAALWDALDVVDDGLELHSGRDPSPR